MRRLLPWAIAALALRVTDIVVLSATGRTESGADDDALQIPGFQIFLLCPAVLLNLGIVARVRWRRGRATNGT